MDVPLLGESGSLQNPYEDPSPQWEDAVSHMLGRRRTPGRVVLWYLGVVLSGGLLWLAGHWFPVFGERMMGEEASLDTCDHVIVCHKSGAKFVEAVVEQEPADEDVGARGEPWQGALGGRTSIRFFLHRMLRYACFHSEGGARFEVARGLESGHQFKNFHALAAATTASARTTRSLLYGSNSIDVDVPPYLILLYREILNPFYIFQAFAIILWIFETYYQYSALLFAMTIVAAGLSLYETRRNLVRLKGMVHMRGRVQLVQRHGGQESVMTVDVSELLPGDVFLVPQAGVTLCCDAVLLTGGCVVNESMLTGESVPVSKTPIPTAGGEADEIYSPDHHKVHTLFCGTHVIYTRAANATAMVVRTGYCTAKGALVRSFMFPRRTRFKFYRDSIIFVCVLFVIGFVGLFYSVGALSRRNVPSDTIAIKSLDIITLIVPPALPVALAVGIIWALYCLRKAQIYCTSPPRVNECGKIKVCCFDKTGTLTEDGLTLWGIHPGEGDMFGSVVTSAVHLHAWIEAAFATCHSLVHMHAGEGVTLLPGAELPFTGDPMEVELFKMIGWELVDSALDIQADTLVRPGPGKQHRESFVVLKRFPFLSALRRMAVIVGACEDGGHGARGPLFVFVKGAPEEVRARCVGESVPADFDERVKEYSRQGLRLIAVAGQQLQGAWEEVPKMGREHVECNLQFLCLVVLQNRVKQESPYVIAELRNANIRSVMVTGDNEYTACSVARESGFVTPHDHFALVSCVQRERGGYELKLTMLENDSGAISQVLPTGLEFVTLKDADADVSHMHANHMRVALAVTGKEFALIAEHMPDELSRLAVAGTVFARMAPDQKTELVHKMQELGYCVCMCGDGANDCGALQAADVGVSLSEAEASVAAPFTSRRPDISCIPILIREGRAAIVTSFSVFKYIVSYSFVEFISAMMLYWLASNLSDNQYIYIDFPVVATVLLICRTPSCPTLSRQRPIGSLLSPFVLASLIGLILIQLAFQVGMYFYLRAQPWFTPLSPNPSQKNIECQENTSIFLFANFQYIALAIAFSMNYPFRLPFYRNYLFVACMLSITGFSLYLTLTYDTWIAHPLKLVDLPSTTYRWILVVAALSNALISIGYEVSLTRNPHMRRLVKMLRFKKGHKNEYKRVALGIYRTLWPSRALQPGTA